MAKAKIKQEINSLNKQDLHEIKEFVEHLSTNDSQDNSTEHSFEQKKVIQPELCHKKASEFLEKVESIISAQENAEDVLGKLYFEVREMQDTKGNPNYLDWVSSTLKNCINTEKNNEYLKFKIIQFFEDWYNGYYPIDEKSLQQHENLFNTMISTAYNEAKTNFEVQDLLGDIYYNHSEE